MAQSDVNRIRIAVLEPVRQRIQHQLATGTPSPSLYVRLGDAPRVGAVVAASSAHATLDVRTDGRFELCFSRLLLGRLARSQGMTSIAETIVVPYDRHDDGVLESLAASLFAALAHRDTRTAAFVAGALLLHCACPHAGIRPHPVADHGIAPWQLERAMDLLDGDASHAPRINLVAEACGFSVSQFIRNFSRAVGLTPYRWLLTQRIERSKILLRTTARRIADIAFECGFNDQSHFTRAFATNIGVSPGRWRKLASADTLLPS